MGRFSGPTDETGETMKKRTGCTIERARQLLADPMLGPVTAKRLYVEVHTFEIGFDTNGNRIAHYTCDLVTDPGESAPHFRICESGHRRPQTGYGGQHEAALLHLGALGYELDLSGATGRDRDGTARYPITNLKTGE